jgi:hypothetical protein
MEGYIDQTKLHQKTILNIEGPLKNFDTSDGARQKFVVSFNDGYKAEFCPLVADVNNLPKSGQSIYFRVKHRGKFGDEIELASVEGAKTVNKETAFIHSMSGHPSTIALNAAVRLAEINHTQADVMPSEVISDAEMFYEWLIKKSQNPL